MTEHIDTNLRHHTQKLKVQMGELILHLRADVGKVTDPRAQALFEVSAEVVAGLIKAFDDFESKQKLAWRYDPADRQAA